jgi:methylase of polypeptide subunit release factors
MTIPLEIGVAVEQVLTREDVESAIKTRGADVYAGFLLRHVRPDMTLLDCGCGEGTITLGLAEAVPEGRVVGVDLKQRDLFAAPPLCRGNRARQPVLDSGRWSPDALS